MKWMSFCLTGMMITAMLLPGCATTGGSQMETTVYDMHKRIVKLDKGLDTSVNRLNETTAELLARVNDSDQQTRRLQTVAEENQIKLDNLARELAELKATVYRQWNLTTSSGFSAPGGSMGGVVIEPPATSLAPPTAPPAPPVTPVTTTSAPPATPPVTPPPAVVAPTPPAPQDPRLFYQQAQKSYSNDDYATALSQFDQYLQQYGAQDPVLSANAQFWKAKCLLNTERYREAIGEFEKVRSNYATSTKVPFAMHNQAVAHSRIGETAQARTLMQEVIDNYPISPAADQAKSDLEKLGAN